MYSCGPLHMDFQKQDDQLEPTYSSSVRIWDVTLRTCRKQWVIRRGGERGSGISLLIAWHNDDDDKNISSCFGSRLAECVRETQRDEVWDWYRETLSEKVRERETERLRQIKDCYIDTICRQIFIALLLLLPSRELPDPNFCFDSPFPLSNCPTDCSVCGYLYIWFHNIYAFLPVILPAVKPRDTFPLFFCLHSWNVLFRIRNWRVC